MILLDVNAWLAASWCRHLHNQDVVDWFEHQPDESLVLCRVTQMGLLRLLSNKAVMGTDVMTRSVAWQAIDYMRSDRRVAWADEPSTLEPVWRAVSARDDNSHKLWTDDYLAAFAQAGQLMLATLDRRIADRYPSVRVETLI